VNAVAGELEHDGTANASSAAGDNGTGATEIFMNGERLGLRLRLDDLGEKLLDSGIGLSATGDRRPLAFASASL
jgi:hypothetical protein